MASRFSAGKPEMRVTTLPLRPLDSMRSRILHGAACLGGCGWLGGRRAGDGARPATTWALSASFANGLWVSVPVGAWGTRGVLRAMAGTVSHPIVARDAQFFVNTTSSKHTISSCCLESIESRPRKDGVLRPLNTTLAGPTPSGCVQAITLQQNGPRTRNENHGLDTHTAVRLLTSVPKTTDELESSGKRVSADHEAWRAVNIACSPSQSAEKKSYSPCGPKLGFSCPPS